MRRSPRNSHFESPAKLSLSSVARAAIPPHYGWLFCPIADLIYPYPKPVYDDPAGRPPTPRIDPGKRKKRNERRLGLLVFFHFLLTWNTKYTHTTECTLFSSLLCKSLAQPAGKMVPAPYTRWRRAFRSSQTFEF